VGLIMIPDLNMRAWTPSGPGHGDESSGGDNGVSKLRKTAMLKTKEMLDARLALSVLT
jgi:hypothetical protein